MKKSKIKTFTIFSSATMMLGIITGCTNQHDLKSSNKEYQEEVVVDTPDEKIESNSQEDILTYDSENVYETNESFLNESELLKFIQSGTESLKQMSQNETIQHVKDTIIHSGLSLTDFILLDKPIGGMRLKDLTSNGKEAVINCLFAVDAIAKDKAPEQYEMLREKVVQVKGKFKEIVIDVIGLENYEYFGELKDKAIDKGKEYWEKGKEYLKEEKQKYKNWREK